MGLGFKNRKMESIIAFAPIIIEAKVNGSAIIGDNGKKPVGMA